MALRKLLVALLATSAWLVFAGAATAAFPNFSDCPSGSIICLNIQNTRGNININGFNVPLGRSLEIRGGLRPTGTGLVFTPPRGTNGFFATPVPVPGGLLGIPFWIPGNSVLAITELAGASATIQVDPDTLTLSVPIKVRLVNLLLGMDCHIGTDSSPVRLTMITGTTSPPPPNRPITGRVNEPTIPDPNHINFTGNVNVENSFAVPGATRCGLNLGLINSLVNLKLGLPSAAGNNSIDMTNNVGLELHF